MIRFVGLQGKRSIEAHFDPELNSLFHAFDALGHRRGHKFWKDERDGMPLGYQGGFQFVPYREIAPPPSDETAALSLIRSVIEDGGAVRGGDGWLRCRAEQRADDRGKLRSGSGTRFQSCP